MKRYIKPNTEFYNIGCSEMMAVSLIEGVDADESEVFSREYQDDGSDWIDWENKQSVLHR